MPLTEQEVLDTTHTFFMAWREQQIASLVMLSARGFQFVESPGTNYQPWLEIALYGQYLLEAGTEEMQFKVENVARQIFGMPGYPKLCVPYWWKSEHRFGRLWNDAYVRAHQAELVSLSRAVEIIKQRKAAENKTFTLQQLSGHLDRETIEAWVDPNPPPKRKTARLVRQDQLGQIP